MTHTKRNQISTQLEIKYRFESLTYPIRNWWKVWRDDVIETACMIPLASAISYTLYTIWAGWL